MKYILLILFFLTTELNTFAQSTKPKKQYTVNINDKDYSAKLDVLSGESKITTKENLTYYWYASNKVMETQGGYDGKLLHGPYTSFYLNNNLKEKGSFKKGLKYGEWISWYENKNIHEISHWKNGVKHGHFKSFNENGEQTLDADYKNGKLNGIKTVYQSGKMISQKNYKNDIEGSLKSDDITKKGVKQRWRKIKGKMKAIFKKQDSSDKKETPTEKKEVPKTPANKPDNK